MDREGTIEKREDVEHINMTTQDAKESSKKEIKATFDLFDRDHDGQVSTDEIATIMRALGMASSEVTLMEMLDKMDKDEYAGQKSQVKSLFLARAQVKSLLEDCDDVFYMDLENKHKRNNGNGIIDYNEFESFVTESGLQLSLTDELDTELLDAFKVFDRDGNGFIDKDELRYVMKTLGEVMTDKEAADMMREADADGDGKIDYKDVKPDVSGGEVRYTPHINV